MNYWLSGLWCQGRGTSASTQTHGGRYATAYANVSPAVAYMMKYPPMTGVKNAAVTEQQ